MPVDLIPLLVILGWTLLSAGVGGGLLLVAARQRRALWLSRRRKARPV